jgi:hypothetical protein
MPNLYVAQRELEASETILANAYVLYNSGQLSESNLNACISRRDKAKTFVASATEAAREISTVAKAAF